MIQNKCSSGETCKMMFPGMSEVTKQLKMKYHQASHTHLKVVSSSKQKEPQIVDWEKTHSGKLIYFKNSPNYCKANPTYDIAGTAGRECTTNATLISSSHHCNNLCCHHGFEQYEKDIPKACNCKFVWCCEVKCETCDVKVKRHRCKA